MLAFRAILCALAVVASVLVIAPAAVAQDPPAPVTNASLTAEGPGAGRFSQAVGPAGVADVSVEDLDLGLVSLLPGDPVAAPLRASPLRASPLRASPLRASPLGLKPLISVEQRELVLVHQADAGDLVDRVRHPRSLVDTAGA